MFLTESSNIETSFNEDTISNIYEVLAETNEEYCKLAIKMCKYEHQAILNEDTILLEEAKEAFGTKVKEGIQRLWRTLADAFAKFKNWLRKLSLKIGGKNASNFISDSFIKKFNNILGGKFKMTGLSPKAIKFIGNKTIKEVYFANGERAEEDKKEYYIKNDEYEFGTVEITTDTIELCKKNLQSMNNDFNDAVKAENDARAKYKASLAKEDKEALSNAAKKSATAFKATRLKYKFIIKIITAAKAAIRNENDSIKSNAKSINKANKYANKF